MKYYEIRARLWTERRPRWNMDGSDVQVAAYGWQIGLHWNDGT